MTDKPEALRLAGYWAAKNDQGEYLYSSLRFREETAAELRRLHAVNQELLEALKDTLQLLEVYCEDFEEGTRKQARAAITKAEAEK
jgi:hypothetical protein